MNSKWFNYKGLGMKNTVLLSFLAVVLLVTSISAYDIPSDIQTAFDERRFDDAISKIEEILKRDKRNYELLYMLGQIYLKQNKLEKAQDALERAVNAKGSFHEARYELGKLYLKTNQLDEARETFEKGLDKAKKDHEKAMFEDGLGLYYIETGDFTKADLNIRKAIIHDPEKLIYNLHQGDINYEQGAYAVAIIAYKKVLEKDSTNPEIHYRLARSYLMQKQFQEALESIDKTLELDSSYADAYLMSGNIWTLYAASQKSDPEKQAAMFANSINLYNKYLEMSGDSGITNYYRGKAYFALNDFEKAIHDFQAALEVGIDKDDLMSLIGRSYSKLKEYNKAIEALNDYEKSILSNNPDYEWTEEDAQLFYERANAYAGIGDSASRLLASEDYQRALELDSNDAMMFYRAGLNEYFVKNFEQALTYYQKSVDLYPDNPSTYLNIAYSYLGMKNWDSTIVYINQALEMNPDYTSAYELLAKVYFNKNDYDSAIIYYQKAKQINPKDCEADRWIGLIYLVRDNPQPGNCIKYLKQYLKCRRAKGENVCDDIEVFVWISKAYQMQNDPNGAFETAREGLKCDPNNEELQKIKDEMEFEIDL